MQKVCFVVVCNSVCGLALLQGRRKRKVRVICNPITGKFLTLPKVIMKAKSNPHTKAEEEIASISLGYDPISKQFKVLCMTSSVDELDERPNAHQVLTLESGKPLWRRIECEFHFRGISRKFDEICINGVLYFRAEMGQSFVIACFDVRSEKFSFINIDKDMLGKFGYYHSTGHLTLFNYKGKLGIHQDTRYWRRVDRDRELVLWVLEDAGNHKWSKHTYELPCLIRVEWFIGMTSTGEIVLSLYNCVYFYNLERDTFARVNFQGFEESDHRTIHIFLDYVENLKLI